MGRNDKPNLLTPRWGKVFTDLWEDKTRTGLVVASIAVGVFAIGMIISAYIILGSDINQSYQAVNPPNIEIATQPFDSGFLRTVAQVPGVKNVDGRQMVNIRTRRGAEKWQNMIVEGLEDVHGPVNLLIPLEGTQYPGKGEVSISQNIVNISGYHPGDIIEVELPDGTKNTLRVAGIVIDQTVSKPETNQGNNAFASMETMNMLGLDSRYNHLFITVNGSGSDLGLINRVADEVKTKVENSGRVVGKMEKKLSTEHPLTSTVLAVLGVLAALGGLITVLSSSLIINTLNALLTQQLRQIGIMKLVGGRSTQIMGMYLVLIVAYSLVALLLAVPLGALAGYGFAWFIANLLGASVGGFRVIPSALITQCVIAFLIPLGAGFFPVNGGAKTKVQEAISNTRTGSPSKKRFLPHFGSGWFSWISRPILLSFRNTFRKKGRLLLTIFTLTVGGAVFIGVFNVRDSMSHVLDQLMQHFMGDVTVDMRQPYKVSRVREVLMQTEGVQGVEGWGGAVGELWDDKNNVLSNISISAPPQDTQLLHPDFVAGRWLLPGEKDAVVISDTIYLFYPHFKIGDPITVKLPGLKEEQWKVVGVFRFVAMFGDPLAYGNFEFIADRLKLPGQAPSFRIVTNLHDTASQEALARRVEATLREHGYLLQRVRAGNGLRAAASQAINVLIIFLLMMAVLTAFVGSIGLMGTMSINVLERTREIGVMRTIGAVDLVIMQSVIIEGLVIGWITWVLAIGLSFPISSFLLKIIGESMMGSDLALTYTPLGILLWLGVVTALSVFASILPARNAAKLTINEVLAYE